MDEPCKGCLIYTGNPTDPDVEICKGYLEKDMNCPCRYCLLKMMCGNPCESFKERPWTRFASNLHQFKLGDIIVK